MEKCSVLPSNGDLFMEKGEEGRVYFCSCYLKWKQYLCHWAQSRLITQIRVSKPHIYCKYSFVFDISKSIQVASLELVNTQIATSYVDLLCCNEFGFNRIM